MGETMASAALKIDRADVRERPAGQAVGQGGKRTPPLRCLLMDDNGFDRRVLRRVAEGSRYEIDMVETAGIAETRAALAGRTADLLLLDYRVPDGDGIAFARELRRDSRHAATPVVVVTGDGSEQAAVQAMRSGAADYLSKDGLTTEEFDQAVENALRRGAAALTTDQSERIEALTAEIDTLRRTSLRNMRLLKGQALPLVSFAWRTLRGEAVAGDARARVAGDLGRITRAVLGLIDETVILAATHRAGEVAGPVDLTEVVAAILKDEGGEIGRSGAEVKVGRLPVLTAQASQMLLLFEELLLTAIRSARLGHAPQVEIGSGVDPDGNPIVWFSERGLPLEARKHATAERFGSLAEAPPRAPRDDYSWSLCQRIVQKNDGELRIAAAGGGDGRGGCTVRMRFPKSMLG